MNVVSGHSILWVPSFMKLHCCSFSGGCCVAVKTRCLKESLLVNCSLFMMADTGRHHRGKKLRAEYYEEIHENP